MPVQVETLGASANDLRLTGRTCQSPGFHVEVHASPKPRSASPAPITFEQKPKTVLWWVQKKAAISYAVVWAILGIFFWSTQRDRFARACLSSLWFSGFFVIFWIYLVGWVLEQPESTSDKINALAERIRQGSEGYFSEQYVTTMKVTFVLATILATIYGIRGAPEGINSSAAFSSWTFGLVMALTFCLGIACSSLAGYAGIWVAVRANVRVAVAAANNNPHEALKICFRAGACSSVINVALGVGSLSLLLAAARIWVNVVDVAKLPMLLSGYAFGASLSALFAQLGGGIYTKAADVGADLVGKVENGIEEDDPRNPAVIADLVGDNVGDCAGQCADTFESMIAEIVATMILGASLAGILKQDPQPFIFFPLVIHIGDLAVSSLMIFLVGRNSKNSTRTLPLDMPSGSAAGPINFDPLTSIKQAYLWTTLGAAIFLCVATLVVLGGNYRFALCGLAGSLLSIVYLYSTQYYTDSRYSHVQKIAKLSESGAGTNVIAGLSVGLQSTVIPIISTGIVIVFSYYQGYASYPEQDSNDRVQSLAGLFGTAMATMGMLGTSVFVLSMSSFGPIGDNAGGIVEMAGLKRNVRVITDALDAAGNVTKANTKGFSVGSAALAALLLFSAFVDEIEILTGTRVHTVDITSPYIFAAGLMGGCLVCCFAGIALSAVGNTAGAVVAEIRKQYRENPGILTFAVQPDYRSCVAVVTKAALKEMVLPGIIAVISPCAVGLAFRMIGCLSGDPFLGIEAMGAFIIMTTSTGILMSLFLNNAGGAWDNAKKWIESGALGGRGSLAHKAAVVGDTVGDPCKDTAGPSIHVLIKLVGTVALLTMPLFVPNGQPID